MDRKKLTYAEAAKMVKPGSLVHTFRDAGALIGADWDRKEILAAIKEFGAELSGPSATAMGHGIVFEDKHGYVFVATR